MERAVHALIAELEKTRRAKTKNPRASTKGRGGSDETKDLRVRCKAHNGLLAEQTCGRAHVEKAKRLRQRKLEPARDERFERLLAMLTGLGFRAKQSRDALERIRNGSEAVDWAGPIEAIVRRAVQMLP